MPLFRLNAIELLEMLELSDRYLLPDLNLRISQQIVRGCMMKPGFLLQVLSYFFLYAMIDLLVLNHGFAQINEFILKCIFSYF